MSVEGVSVGHALLVSGHRQCVTLVLKNTLKNTHKTCINMILDIFTSGTGEIEGKGIEN